MHENLTKSDRNSSPEYNMTYIGEQNIQFKEVARAFMADGRVYVSSLHV